MRPRSSFGLKLFLDWLLICVGVFGSMLCLCTAFDLPVLPERHEPVFPALWLIPAMLALMGCFCYRGKRGKYWALGTLGVLLLGAFLLRREILESFRNLWGVLSVRYARGYDQLQNLVPREPTSAANTRAALLITAILESVLCTIAVRLWRRTLPAALALLPGILPCFILTDTPPALLPLLAAAFSVLTQAYSQAVRRRDAGEEPKAVCIGALLSAGLLGLMLLLFPRESFKPPVTWKDLSREMEQWSARQNNLGNLNAGLSGNPDEVNLHALGALPNHPSPALYVLSTRDGAVYLRGSGYNDFDGERWLRGAERSWSRELLFPYQRRSDGATLTVESAEPEGLMYTTYQTTQPPASGEPVSDVYLRNTEGRRRYTQQYLPDLGKVFPDAAYEQAVRERCLQLPEQTRRAVLDWWEQHRGDMPREPVQGVVHDGTTLYVMLDGFSSQEELAERVAALVSSCARYSRNPLPAPEGTDFCGWFLNEAEEGYCVHFATACTALLRALGVPARYVSGYVCNLTANHTATVTNLQAHAWVEIYTDGRWVCVEPTPGDATEFAGWNGGNGVDPEESRSSLPTERHEPLTDTLPPEPTEPTRPAPTRPSRDANEPTEPGGGGEDPAAPADLTPLWIFLGVAGFLALVLGRRALALRLWERRLAQAPVNQRARLYYRRILRLQRHGGGSVSEEAERAAKKAGFSQHTLSDEELELLRQAYDRQRCRVAIRGFWRKLYCKYVLAII